MAKHGFVRVHKSYLVATGKIDGIEGNELFIQSHRVPISRHYRDGVVETVLTNKFWENK